MFFLRLFLTLRSNRQTLVCSDPLLSYCNYISAFLSGGGKKGVAIRPYPSPGPPPFIPNAFLKSGTLTGSDSCWASSPTRECELGEEFLLAKKKLRPTQNLLSSTRPNTNRSPQGFAHIKSVRVEGDGALGKGQRAG